nr:MAG TPA: hypothetical protein [Caudoviricetes sp.]
MNKKNILSKLRLWRIELEKVHGERCDHEEFSDDTKMLSEWNLLPLGF